MRERPVSTYFPSESALPSVALLSLCNQHPAVEELPVYLLNPFVSSSLMSLSELEIVDTAPTRKRVVCGKLKRPVPTADLLVLW
jgi:hypothetical protein